MNIYNFIKETKEFISQSGANKNPLEDGKYLIPANATTIEVLPFKDGFKIIFDEVKKEWEYLKIPTVYVFDSETNEYKSSHKNTFLIGYKQFKIEENETIIEPLITKENFAVCFNKDSNEWEYKEDNRNKTVYSTITKEASIIDYLGVIKDGFTLSVPTEFDKWENNTWIKDIEAIRASKLLIINTECNKAIVSGFKSSTLGEEYFYYSTLEEQTTLNSLINLGFDSNFKAQKISLVEGVEIKGERKQYPHTLAQLREILIAGATHIKAQIDKKDLLEIQINNATTAAELELINW
ncbi:MAG: hypothetical protein AB7D41_03580 [Arcobacter sp.]|uniref:DUF4376 domain-containing protein n=1 Tax=Arcobacter sp. TaxID=1872629 RepID=UPI003D046D42